MNTWLSLDKRSLALVRIALGTVLLVDILLRGAYFRAHYTSLGIMPLSSHLEQFTGSPQRWSVFYLSDHPLAVAGLFALFFLAALSLTVGYRSRLAGWICWILAVSVYRRGPLLGDAGDLYLAALLFWGNFLPWADRFGVEQLESDDEPEQSLAGFCYLLQICIVYWFSAVLRVGKEWQVDDSALYFAMSIEPMGIGFNDTLLTFGSHFLSFMTVTTLLFEALGPVLLFLPGARVRILSVLLIVVFHLGIVFTLRVPLFAVVCVLAPLGLLPSKFWGWSFAKKLSGALTALGSAASQRIGLRERVPGESRFKRFQGALPLVFMLIVIYQLNAGLTSRSPVTPLSSVARLFGLEQRWGMFSPHPTNEVGWEAVQARTSSGREVNLLTWAEMPETPPERPNHTNILLFRWRLYHLALNYRREMPIRRYLEYLVAQWNEVHPEEPVVAAQYLYYPRVTEPDYILGKEGTEVLAVYHRPPQEDSL